MGWLARNNQRGLGQRLRRYYTQELQQKADFWRGRREVEGPPDMKVLLGAHKRMWLQAQKRADPRRLALLDPALIPELIEAELDCLASFATATGIDPEQAVAAREEQARLEGAG